MEERRIQIKTLKKMIKDKDRTIEDLLDKSKKMGNPA